MGHTLTNSVSEWTLRESHALGIDTKYLEHNPYRHRFNFELFKYLALSLSYRLTAGGICRPGPKVLFLSRGNFPATMRSFLALWLLTLIALQKFPKPTGAAAADAYPAVKHGTLYMYNYDIPPAPGSTPWAPCWSPGGEVDCHRDARFHLADRSGNRRRSRAQQRRICEFPRLVEGWKVVSFRRRTTPGNACSLRS